MPFVRRRRSALLRPLRVGAILNDVITQQGLGQGFILPRVQAAWIRAAGVTPLTTRSGTTL